MVDPNTFDEWRRFTRETESVDIGREYDLVYQRKNDGEWEEEQCSWEGEAEEGFENECSERLGQGWVEVETQAPSLLDRQEAIHGPLPEGYKDFLRRGLHEKFSECTVSGLPTFKDDAELWADISSTKCLAMDFCGLNPDSRYLAISGFLYDANNRHGDPHPLFLAIDKNESVAPVVLVGSGSITPAFESFKDFCQRFNPSPQ